MTPEEFSRDMTDRPPWQDDALCAQVGDEFWFPEKGGSTAPAKRVCMSCPVSAECLAYAMARQERFGIWGGYSERERRKLAKGAEFSPGLGFQGQQIPTGTETQVRELLDQDISVEQIAATVGVSARTVRRIRDRRRAA